MTTTIEHIDQAPADARGHAPGLAVASRTIHSPAARAVDAVKVYGRGEAEVRALDGITVDFEAGRFTAIMGPSGSGKSTLVHALAGLDTLTSGSVWIGDTDLGALNERKLTQLRRDRVGFVFQQFNLIPTLTARENVEIALAPANLEPGARERRARELLERVGLSGRAEHLPSQLSGGEQQRVAIARALVKNPELVLADEPTGNLDSIAAEEIMVLLKNLRSENQTVVMVTHDPRMAGYADRIVFLKDGRVVDEETIRS
jgi:putative ABC transport system ATP-binding protein